MHPPPYNAPVIIETAMIMGNAFRKIEEGMSKEELLKLLGKPDGFKRDGDAETLTYANRMMSGWGWDRADYYVVLTDGKVSSYGTGEVRDRRPNTVVVVPAPLPH